MVMEGPWPSYLCQLLLLAPSGPDLKLFLCALSSSVGPSPRMETAGDRWHREQLCTYQLSWQGRRRRRGDVEGRVWCADPRPMHPKEV